jgi:membrane-associated phospholipid phosphatase
MTTGRTGSDARGPGPRLPIERRDAGREVVRAVRRLWLPAVLVTAGMVVLGLLVAHGLARGWLGRQDAAADRALVSARSPAGNTVTGVLTGLASTPVIIGLTAAAAVAFRVAYGRWREPLFIVLCTGLETAIFLVTTLVVDRNRPPVPHLDVAPPTSSFPSGHTAAALCYYGGLAAVVLYRHHRRLLRAAATSVAVVLPLLVGVSRLYRGMHFPTDVLAGLLLGGGWLAIVTGRFLHDASPESGR